MIRHDIIGVAGSVTMQSESVTKRSHGYDVWFAVEWTRTARVTCPAPAELYPGEKGPFRIFDCLQKNLVFSRKMWYFSRKIRICYNVRAAIDVSVKRR